MGRSSDKKLVTATSVFFYRCDIVDGWIKVNITWEKHGEKDGGQMYHVLSARVMQGSHLTIGFCAPHLDKILTS
jgi:hypothetical protein